MREDEVYLMARSQREERTSIPQSSLRAYTYWPDLRIRTFQKIKRFLYLSVKLENLSSVGSLLVNWLSDGLCDQSPEFETQLDFFWLWAYYFTLLGLKSGDDDAILWDGALPWEMVHMRCGKWEVCFCACWSTVVRIPPSLLKSLFIELCGGGQWATCGMDTLLSNNMP